MQGRTHGELVCRSEQYGACARQVPGVRAQFVEGERSRAQTGRRQQLPVEIQAVRLDGDRPDPARTQYRAEDLQAVHEARAYEDAVGVGAHTARSGEVLRERGAQFDAASRVAVAEGLVGRRRQGATGGLEPLGTREGGQVGAAGLQVVGGAPALAGAGPLFRRCHHGPRRPPGARAQAWGEAARGAEGGGGGGDRVAGDAQVGGERAGGGQPRAGRQPAGADRLAQRVRQALAQARSGRLDMEVDPQSGP